MDVAIVGGGVMGCACALALAARGVRVVILERAVPGAEASSAAAGILGAQIESHAATGPGASARAGLATSESMLRTFVRARAGYRAWAAMLRETTGIDVGYRASGLLRVAMTDADAEDVARDVAWQVSEGLRAELVDAKRARTIEPELAPGVRAAAYFPDESQVDPPALLRALIAAAARAGVETRSGTPVSRLLVEGDRCVGVAVDDPRPAGLHGTDIRADAVILAAGSWSSLVPGVPRDLPAVRPARGQIVLVDERPPRLRTMVVGARSGAYLVPRGDGRVLCGSTLELVGFRREVTAGGVHGILAGCLEIVPSLDAAELVSTWSSFRPYVGEEAPLVGAAPLPGLFLATGHHRNGILLAAVTGDAVADAILGPTPGASK